MSLKFYLTEKNSRIISVIITVLLLAGIVFSQHLFDLEKNKRSLTTPTTIPAQAIKLANLGLNSASSALIWIYTIQNLLDYPEKTPELIRITNDLDPKFSYPYAFAALVLPVLNLTNQGVEIAEKGINKAETDWRVPYYLATTYHIFLQNREKAALYFSIAADTPGVPENIKFVAVRYGTSQYLEQTKQIWISILETSNDEFVIEKAKNHVIHMEMLGIIQKAMSFYKQKYGLYPSSINELIKKQILKEVPKSPLGVNFGVKDGKIIIQ